MIIIPTIFVKSKKEFTDRFKKLKAFSNLLQIDLMDGLFVPIMSISLKDIPNLKRYKLNFEAHLMVENPQKYIKKLKTKGFNKVLIHYESKNIDDAIKLSKKEKLITFLAVNPNTKIKEFNYLIPNIDGIMFMGVNPGKEKQKLIKKVLKKIKTTKKLYPRLPIQIDGGVNEKTIKKISKTGIDLINSGSFINNAKDPKIAIKTLISLAHS